MSMARDRHCLAVTFVTITADELLDTMVVAGWGWYFSISVVLIGAALWPLVNKAPSLASMDETITLRTMDNSRYSGPLGSDITVVSLVGSCGWLTNNKNPLVQICPYGTPK